MKKLSAFLLSMVFMFSLSVSVLGADTESFTFAILADGKSASTVEIGDTISVSLVMTCDSGNGYDLYNMQDYICFDTDYFAYVEGSIAVYQASNEGIPYDLFSASPIDFNTGTDSRIFVNRSNNRAYAVETEMTVASFQLTALKIGTTTLSHDVVQMLTETVDYLTVTEKSASVTITSVATDEDDDNSTVTSSGGSSGGSVATASAETASTDSEVTYFDDVVDVDAYYYEAVYWAVEHGITTGMSDGTFRPEASCTRAQAVTFLYRAAGEPEVTGSNPFADVETDGYYYNAVLWAVENGITEGMNETDFAPDSVCSRSQIATFLYRMAGEPEVTGTNLFTDVDGDSYYNDAVLWAEEQGIASGITDTSFAPVSNCTRGHIVTFLYRYMVD